MLRRRAALTRHAAHAAGGAVAREWAGTPTGRLECVGGPIRQHGAVVTAALDATAEDQRGRLVAAAGGDGTRLATDDQPREFNTDRSREFDTEAFARRIVDPAAAKARALLDQHAQCHAERGQPDTKAVDGHLCA